MSLGKRFSRRDVHCCVASKPLRFHPQAEQEYLTALSWYQERSLTAAMSLEGAFDQALERIREAAYRWPIYFKDFRKYTLRQFPDFRATFSRQHPCVDRTLEAHLKNCRASQRRTGDEPVPAVDRFAHNTHSRVVLSSKSSCAAEQGWLYCPPSSVYSFSPLSSGDSCSRLELWFHVGSTTRTLQS